MERPINITGKKSICDLPQLGFPLLRMEIDRNNIADDNTFEYNNYPFEEAQSIWLADWFKRKQVEFNLKIEDFWKQKDYMKHLTDLFKDSYEVNGFKIKTVNSLTNISLRIAEKPTNIFGWTKQMKPSLPLPTSHGSTKKIK